MTPTAPQTEITNAVTPLLDDYEMVGRIEGQTVTYWIRRTGLPGRRQMLLSARDVLWNGEEGAEFLLPGPDGRVSLALDDLVAARRRIQRQLAVNLRRLGHSVRGIAEVVGVHRTQVERWTTKRAGEDQAGNSYVAFLDRLDEELGPPSDEAYGWARQALKSPVAGPTV